MSMAQVDAWVTVASSAITGAAALGTAAWAQQAARARDHDGRLWERRLAAYVELIRWLQSLMELPDVAESKSSGADGGRVDALRPIPAQLRAEVTAYGSLAVYGQTERCVDHVRNVAAAGLHASKDELDRLHGRADDLVEYVREELQKGRDPFNLMFAELLFFSLTAPLAIWWSRRHRRRTGDSPADEVSPLIFTRGGAD